MLKKKNKGKDTDLFDIVLCDTGNFIRKGRLKKAVQLQYFHARYDEQWKVIGQRV